MHRLCESFGLGGTAMKEIQGRNNKNKHLPKITVTRNYYWITFFLTMHPEQALCSPLLPFMAKCGDNGGRHNRTVRSGEDGIHRKKINLCFLNGLYLIFFSFWFLYCYSQIWSCTSGTITWDTPKWNSDFRKGLQFISQVRGNYLVAFWRFKEGKIMC